MNLPGIDNEQKLNEEFQKCQYLLDSIDTDQ